MHDYLNPDRGSSGTLNDDEVMEPRFRLSEGVYGQQTCHQLHVETFEHYTGDEHPPFWLPRAEDQWHLLARFFPDSIHTYPVFLNPHAKRYLKPRHGRISTVIYFDKEGVATPTSARNAISQVDFFFLGQVFNDCHFGLGVTEELDVVWQEIMRIPEVHALRIAVDCSLELRDGIVHLSETYLDSQRRNFDRIRRRIRGSEKDSKRLVLNQTLLSELAPDRFPKIEIVDSNGELVEFRMGGRKNTPAQQRRKSIQAIRKNLSAIADESPDSLLKLHADIERVTLATMVQNLEEMLSRDLSETRWQRFFEQNVFILSMAFSRPVQLLHTQFHAHPTTLDGSGAQIGDYLLNLGNGLAIVEIKKPGCSLMLDSTYRGRTTNGVYGPNAELSGAVTQVLAQKHALIQNWQYHFTNNSYLRDARPESIRCVIVAGRYPSDEAKSRSFELFRNASRDVEILTFDELLEKLKLLLSHLNPMQPSSDPPF